MDMASEKSPKTWVLTTSQDFTPGGVLCLGQLLTDPWDPSSAILARGVVPPPPDVLRDVISHKKVDLQSQTKDQTSLRAWLGVHGQGGDADFDHGTETCSSYESSAIKIDMFQPDDEYAKDVLAATKSSKTTIPWYRFTVNLYLVTGHRILVSGTQVDNTTSTTSHSSAAFRADGSSSGVPIQGGAGLGSHAVNGHHQKLGETSEFVYAYRLHKIIKRRYESSSIDTWGRGQLHSSSGHFQPNNNRKGLDYIDMDSGDESDARGAMHADEAERNAEPSERLEEFDEIEVASDPFVGDKQHEDRLVE